MRIIFLFFILANILFAIPAKDAYKYVGESVEVCGKVVEIFRHNNGHVFLNIDGRYPNQKISFVIWNKYTKNFRGLRLKNKKICVKGLIREYRGRLQIFLKNKNQLRFE